MKRTGWNEKVIIRVKIGFNGIKRKHVKEIKT